MNNSPRWTLWDRLLDSYFHYRDTVGCRRLEACWRAFAYDVLHWPDGIKSTTKRGRNR